MEALQSLQSKSIPQWWIWGMLIFAFIGFLDAAYLTAEHYLGLEVPCTVLDGCEEVLNSEYSTIFGIPVALYGAFYYLAVLLCVVAYIDRGSRKFLQLAVLFPITGFLATLWFVFAQVFLLQSLCLYCLVSAFTTSTLFALSLYFIFHGYFKGNRGSTAL